MNSIANYAETLTPATVQQFANLVEKFDKIQLKIVDFNSQTTPPEFNLDLESAQQQFFDLVYTSQGIF